MKNLKQIKPRLIVMLLSLLLTFTFSCKKDVTTSNTDVSSLTQQVADESNIQQASDDIESDNTNLASQLTNTRSIIHFPLNSTVVFDSTTSDTIKATITFNGPSVTGKFTRSGQIILRKI